MTFDRHDEPRCSDCANVLPRSGAICHICDVDAHFEGALRTAPPINNPWTSPGLRRRSGLRAF